MVPKNYCEPKHWNINFMKTSKQEEPISLPQHAEKVHHSDKMQLLGRMKIMQFRKTENCSITQPFFRQTNRQGRLRDICRCVRCELVILNMAEQILRVPHDSSQRIQDKNSASTQRYRWVNVGPTKGSLELGRRIQSRPE